MTLWQLKDIFSVSETALSPSNYSSEKVIIDITSSNVPANWVGAGWCRAVYTIPAVGEVKSKWEELALNEKKLLIFPVIAEYRIFFELKIWISLVNISVWEGIN